MTNPLQGLIDAFDAERARIEAVGRVIERGSDPAAIADADGDFGPDGLFSAARPCPTCHLPHAAGSDQTHYRCVICKLLAPLEQSVAVAGSRERGRWPSHRCADADACVARLLEQAGSPWCGCDHIHPAGASLCYVCDLPLKPEGSTDAASQ